MKSEIPFSRMRAKNTAKNTALFPLLRQKEKQKYLDLTERGKSDDIAHGSIIRDITVLVSTAYNIPIPF